MYYLLQIFLIGTFLLLSFETTGVTRPRSSFFIPLDAKDFRPRNLTPIEQSDLEKEDDNDDKTTQIFTEDLSAESYSYLAIPVRRNISYGYKMHHKSFMLKTLLSAVVFNKEIINLNKIKLLFQGCASLFGSYITIKLLSQADLAMRDYTSTSEMPLRLLAFVNHTFFQNADLIRKTLLENTEDSEPNSTQTILMLMRTILPLIRTPNEHPCHLIT